MIYSLFGRAAVHTERKAAGTEAGIISPSLMILEAERCVFHEAFFFSMKKFKGKSFIHTQERSIFYCYIVWRPQRLFPSSNSAGKGRIVYLLAVSSLSKA